MLYSELYRQVLAGAAAASEKASSVDDTNAAILHALTSPNPRTRYIVGQKVCCCLLFFLRDLLIECTVRVAYSLDGRA